VKRIVQPFVTLRCLSDGRDDRDVRTALTVAGCPYQVGGLRKTAWEARRAGVSYFGLFGTGQTLFPIPRASSWPGRSVLIFFRVAASNPASRRVAGVQTEPRRIEGRLVRPSHPPGCWQSVAVECAEGRALRRDAASAAV
jgi:hypothetical protein